MLFKPCLQCALKRHLAAVLQGERQPPQRLVQMAVDGLLLHPYCVVSCAAVCFPAL